MTGYPPSVLAAAESAINDAHTKRGWNKPAPWWTAELAAAILDAAAPVLAEALLTPLAKRHAMIPGEWGAGYCGTCWIKGGSRAAWPCAEILAIAEILPASTEAATVQTTTTTPAG